MRKQRVALEHHCHIAFSGRYVVNNPAAHIKFAAGNFFKARNHAQRGGFAAAGRPEQNQAFAFFYFQIQRFNNFGISVRFTYIIKNYAVHY